MRATKKQPPAEERIAERIADGVPVEWDAEGLRTARVDNLRILERIATTYERTATAPASESTQDADLGEFRDREDDAQRRPLFVWGQLHVLEKIGEGKFGDVYRAYDPVLKTEVALKLRRGMPSREHAVRDFLKEARRLARARHPNVLVVHGADVHDGRVGLWTDLVVGRTLAECVEQQGPFSAREAALIGVDLCSALAKLHSEGLLHRDIKPSNMMREQGGRILLMDFGCACERESTRSAVGGDGIQGTPITTAPEVLLHEATYHPSSDIYSMGVVLYWLVSGRYPVQASSFEELCDKHRSAAAVPLVDVRPDIPESFARIVERALAPDPRQRFGSPGEMGRALATWAGAPLPAPRPVDKLKLWGGAAALLALLAIVYWIFVPHDPFAVSASLYRSAAVRNQLLASGTSVRPGDRLFLELESSKEIHAYVLAQDDLGKPVVLFPVRTEIQNPLERGIHRLPGPIEGREQSWVVSSSGQFEKIRVISSRRSLQDLEQEIASLRSVSSGRPAWGAGDPESQTTQTDAVRGINEMQPDEPDSSSGSWGAFEKVVKQLESRTDVQVFRFDLPHEIP